VAALLMVISVKHYWGDVICHASRYDPTTSPVSSARPRRPQQIAKIHHYIELATVDLQTDPSALFAVTVMY